MGGELWFETRCSLFPPRDEQQLADTATVFEDYGYGNYIQHAVPAGPQVPRRHGRGVPPYRAASIRSHWIPSGVSGRGSSAST